MRQEDAERLILNLYKYVLKRSPRQSEFQGWVQRAVSGSSIESIVRAFFNSDELRRKTEVSSTFYAGHYHSPVVNPETVRSYVDRERLTAPGEMKGLALDIDRMRALWTESLPFIKTSPFTDSPTPQNRYHYLGGPYPWGDAITLRMMIGHLKPRRVVEIGSGFSSACMLDSAEHAGLSNFHLTCIEPNPARLKSLLREGDEARLTLIEKGVQEVGADIVDQLEANDILFIDSTHVMKTGSDVHYEFFHLLPRVKPGVIIHVHDVPFPFEYPDKWIFELNYSWNEAYVLRAFLMFNTQFRVLFWNSLFAREHLAAIKQECPDFLKNPGSSIWIERVQPAA